MAEDNGNDSNGLRKFVLPAAVSVAGAGAGLVLSNRSKLKESVPDVKGGVGDLATDLRNKLESVLGKDDSSGSDDSSGESSADASSKDSAQSSGEYTPAELSERRRERKERRDGRRAKT